MQRNILKPLFKARMQSVGFAQAKIQTPLFRSGLIERGELEQRLGDAMATRRLVLLVAPAGYGKTAALSRQLQRLPQGCAVAWLTADEEDDLQRLLSHLIEALEPLDPPWRQAPQALLELVTEGRLREAAVALLNTLEATDTPGGGVLVLDDLHAVADPHVFEFLGHLLEDLPSNWTLVIASRVEPPLALGRWRARREVAEFNETALSFSQVEVQELWRHVTGREDADQAARLLQRTQGWAAGLCLSLGTSERSLATAPKSIWNNRRHLFDYLASEVFEQLPGELQEFLLRCSLLPELTAPRCEQISGNPRAAKLLEDIERRRLFISVLDGEELMLRLHDLFRDFLEERLRRLHPAEVPALLRRAAEGEADPLRRTLTYLRAGAWEEAQQGIADAAPDLLASGEGGQVVRVIEQFPAHIQAQSPLLSYTRGLCEWWQYQYAAVRSHMAHAAAGFDALGRHDDAQHARAMQALTMLFSGHTDDARRLSQAVRSQAMDLETETLSELLDFWYEGYHGPINGPGDHLAKMLDLLVKGGSAELWSRCIPRINSFLARPGVSTQIQRLIRGARAAAGDRYWSLHANANLTEAWLLLWQGRFTELNAAFQLLEEDVRWLGRSVASLIRLLVLKSHYQMICDDNDAVHATCDAIVAQTSLLGRSSNPPVVTLGIVAEISASIEDWPVVRMHLRSLNVQSPLTQRLGRVLKAQLALQEGRVDDALTTLRELVTRSTQLDAIFHDATVRKQLALAELAAGSPRAAWQALKPLIDHVLANGNVGQIMCSGVQSLVELSRAPWGDAASKEGLAALRQWADAVLLLKAGSQEKPLTSATQDVGLSVRELEVLALLAEGQSNKLIARVLNLSPHTVKRHVARILDRLDLTSRMQAANWYRARFDA